MNRRSHGTALWQGFDFSWGLTPHRLDHLSSVLDELSAESDGSLAGVHRTRFTVGRVPDFGSARTLVSGLRAPGLGFWEGRIGTRLEAEVGAGVRSRTDPIRLPLPKGEVGTVLLRGFELACQSHPAGLHTRGFGVRLVDIESDDEGLSFAAELFVHAANSPDRLTASSGRYAYELTACYTAVFGTEDAVAFESDGALPSVALRQATLDPDDLEPLRLARERPAAAHLEATTVGIHGFEWRQRAEGPRSSSGRYLRRLALGITDTEVREDGLHLRPRCAFSNRGLVNYPVEVDHQLWLTVVRHRAEWPPLPTTTLTAPIPLGVGRGGEGARPFRLR